MKENKYTKSLAKNQVCARYLEKRFTQIYKALETDCIGVYATYSEKRFTQICKGLETPCWFPFERHKYGRRKPTETSFPTYA